MKHPPVYIPRFLEKELESVMDSPEIIAIIGPRQCGKTTLMNQIAGRLDADRIRMISFEDRDELNLFVHDIKSFADLHVRDREYLFIDEFQYAPGGGKHLKYLYDTFPVKICITGSSSTELSVQSIQYLVGRIFVFHLYPFSFQEYLQFKNPELEQLIPGNTTFSAEIIRRVHQNYTDFLVYGGYPRVILSSSDKEKETVLKNIFNTYLLREINQILGYSEEFKLTKLIRALALQAGSSVNYNELGAVTGFAYKDLMEALDILEKTFVIARCVPFYQNKRLELVKSPKFYFVDSGFRNMAIRNFLPLPRRSDTGALNENFISGELLKNDDFLRYWRTKSGAEVDFIVEKHGEMLPVEVKTVLHKPVVSRSFRSFLEKYSPPRGIILSSHLCEKTMIGSIPVEFLPHWALMNWLNGLS